MGLLVTESLFFILLRLYLHVQFKELFLFLYFFISLFEYAGRDPLYVFYSIDLILAQKQAREVLSAINKAIGAGRLI